MKPGDNVTTVDGVIIVIGVHVNGKHVYTFGEKRGWEHWRTEDFAKLIERYSK